MNSRVVFVGNIPYDVTEPQIISIMEEAGNVVSLKLVFDRETGKSKGYAFCTFQDPETAASAVRNLNGRDVNGRPLKLDYAEMEKDNYEDRSGYGGPPQHPSHPGSRYGRNQPSHLPPSQPPQASAIETINQVINAMQPQHLVELLSYFKFMVQSNPDQCRTLLQQQPQLAYTLFQTLLKMNIIDQFAMQRILQAQMNAPAPGSAHLQGGSPGIPQQHGMGAPPPMPAPIPPQAAQPPVMQQAPAQDQQAALMQLLSLTPEQLQLLPPDQQQQILLLRAQLLGQ